MSKHLSKAVHRRVTSVFHVGSLNPADKRKDSQEGNGLSVSEHPEAWASIARLGGNPLHKLTKGTSGQQGAFLEFRSLTEAALRELGEWGIKNGWAQAEKRWRVSWFDSEYDGRVHTLMATEESGRDEAKGIREEGDSTARCVEVLVPVLTPKSIERLGFKLDALSTLDMLATFWVEDETELDGVWWDDLLAPHALSAPRGVICLKRLPLWTAKVHRSSAKIR